MSNNRSFGLTEPKTNKRKGMKNFWFGFCSVLAIFVLFREHHRSPFSFLLISRTLSVSKLRTSSGTIYAPGWTTFGSPNQVRNQTKTKPVSVNQSPDSGNRNRTKIDLKFWIHNQNRTETWNFNNRDGSSNWCQFLSYGFVLFRDRHHHHLFRKRQFSSVR